MEIGKHFGMSQFNPTTLKFRVRAHAPISENMYIFEKNWQL